ncbi:sensor domain-containing diguanylate cyclase [Paenibacillus ginsengarvi]|uniref:GGDEF domain-containing protein n=1 Tax=Paenibacillus ginsengarvi TaxID=400777 RepID=A0A3B0CGZ2_9BACL|nr:GGDEF domain-containing protein [Paenibacillus ginsengarvi]RKN85055.1 GGDEF domain-containing protein [Paenibacillus ginsengarvi]
MAKVESTRTFVEATLNVSELLFGPYARLYGYAGSLVMLTMILVMSVRLFTSRRRKAYLSLTASVLVFLVYYVVMIAGSLFGAQDEARLDLAAQTIHVVAFIMMNRAIYQLYNSTQKRHHLYFYASLLLTLLLALFRIFVPSLFEGAPEQLAELGRIGPDVYLLLLVFICFIFIPAQIGQMRRYQFGLLVFFSIHLSYLINRYMLETPSPVLTFVELYAPLLYYFILFMLFFERIVELMQASMHSAITDGLTGLYNRRYMLSKTNQYIRLGYPVSVLFSDIDNFKKLNDTKGHHAGDEALKAVARIMMEESEEIGFAGRFGGEEMVVLVTDPSIDMGKFSEKVRGRIEAETGVTVSIGYSKTKSREDDVSAEQLIAQADQAMYKAKTTGKNKVVKFTVSLGNAAK